MQGVANPEGSDSADAAATKRPSQQYDEDGDDGNSDVDTKEELGDDDDEHFDITTRDEPEQPTTATPIPIPWRGRDRSRESD